MTSAITGTGSAAPARAFDWRNLIKQRYLIIAIAFIVVAFVTAGGSSYSIYIVDTILLSAIGAMALDLLMGTGGQVSIGNVAFLAGGAFAAVWAISRRRTLPVRRDHRRVGMCRVRFHGGLASLANTRHVPGASYPRRVLPG